MSERYITMSDLTAALEENRVKEMFGAGTACIVCPISKILYKGKVRFLFFLPLQNFLIMNCSQKKNKKSSKTKQKPQPTTKKPTNEVEKECCLRLVER